MKSASEEVIFKKCSTLSDNCAPRVVVNISADSHLLQHPPAAVSLHRLINPVGKMSDSECEYFLQQAATTEKKTTSNRKPSGDNNGKRKSRPPSANLIRTSKKINTGNDIFGISKHRETGSEDSSDKTCLTSFFVNRVANGSERRSASIDGEYYIDCKVYKADDARHSDSQELWKKALIRLKFQTNTDSPQWRKLQEFMRSVDVLFTEKPMFYDK